MLIHNRTIEEIDSYLDQINAPDGLTLNMDVVGDPKQYAKEMPCIEFKVGDIVLFIQTSPETAEVVIFDPATKIESVNKLIRKYFMRVKVASPLKEKVVN